MGQEYHSANDVQMRIGDSICMYKNQPYYVTLGEGKDNVRLHDLENNNFVGMVKYTDDDFSYKPFPLGYINFPSGSYFMARSPDRRQKQGLTRDLIRFYGTAPQERYFTSKALKDTIIGNYPTLEQAVNETLQGLTNKRAFHRFFAVKRINNSTVELLFRDKKIGFKNKTADRFTLYPGPEFSFYFRSLPKYGVPL